MNTARGFFSTDPPQFECRDGSSHTENHGQPPLFPKEIPESSLGVGSFNFIEIAS
jgi:hypothetical protein